MVSVKGLTEVMESEPFPTQGAINIAVVTGGHPYNVPAFHHLFKSLKGIDAYIQDLETFFNDYGSVRTIYDVALFFNWHLAIPSDNECQWYQQGMAQTLEEIGQTKQGIVLMHHAVYAFPEWPFWSEMTGIPHKERRFTFSEDSFSTSLFETIHYRIADPEHPIMQGIQPWDVVGETWDFGALNPGPDCHVLMTTDHPKMRMQSTAWTHQFRNSRVFYLQAGHNNDAWSHPTFRTLLTRGIQWAAGRL